MLTQFEARTVQGTLLSFPLEDVSSGFEIKDIAGLDPVKANIVSSKFAQMNGEQYNSSSLGTRNIVIKVKLRADYVSATTKDLRNTIYSFFMPESLVELHFYDSDGTIVNISGRVESCDAPLFTDKPVATISIICFDPEFIGADSIVVNGNTQELTTETLVTYPGTAETGIVFTINVNRNLPSFTIYNRQPGNITQTLQFTSDLISGDVLKISTIPNDKWVTLTRSGNDSSLLYGIPAQTDWISFIQGDNYVRVGATGAGVPYSISYYLRYGGL